MAFVTYASNGLQNGSPDGVALVDASNNVIQFLSYEGTFTAVGGPADGMTSTDIGVAETGSDPLGYSLQLTGTGTSYEDFNWAADAPSTFGAFNNDQIFGAVVIPTDPSGTGSADPASLLAGDSVLLTMAVTPGTNPDSTGLAVSCDLSSIGGSGSQSFFDDGTNGDVTTGDDTFSFQANVDGGTSVGSYSLPCSITDAEIRNGAATINLTVQAPAPPPGDVVISQIYGGGGNSGATLKNDFVELFNRTATPVDLTGWSVQYASSTGSSWQTTTLSGSIAAGKYYLVQEAAGSGGTLNLPTPDAIGTISMSGTGAKVALVNNSISLSGTCPTGPNISDFVGYGTSANCYEGGGRAPRRVIQLPSSALVTVRRIRIITTSILSPVHQTRVTGTSHLAQ